jgi:acyl carrier protein
MSINIHDLIPIFRDVFENEELDLNENTIAADVPEWDSLNHIYLIVAIEKHFKIKFTTHQIQSWKCVGDVLTDLNKQS